MLNFRKLKHDFPPAILKEGKAIYDKEMVIGAKIAELQPAFVRLTCKVQGAFNHAYELELEIDTIESTIIDSDCDCPYNYDCQHLAAVLLYLEAHYNQILLEYSHENDIQETKEEGKKEDSILVEALKEAKTKEHARLDKKLQKEMVDEYLVASQILSTCSFFQPEDDPVYDQAELAIIFNASSNPLENNPVEIQIALRLPQRSKPLNITNVKSFFESIRYGETFYLGNRRYLFSPSSFDDSGKEILKLLIDFGHVPEGKNDKQNRCIYLDKENFGILLSIAHQKAEKNIQNKAFNQEKESNEETSFLPSIYVNSLEEQLKFSTKPAKVHFAIEHIKVLHSKILLEPKILLNKEAISPHSLLLLECAKPGAIYQNTYYPFINTIKRKHLKSLSDIRDMTIPEPLFGTFVENALPELRRFAEVSNIEAIDPFVTLPFAEGLKGECDIFYLNGELEAALYFLYGPTKIPAALSQASFQEISSFIRQEGILARNLTEEQRLIQILFQDFVFHSNTGLFSTKTEKKIIEFMTETVPAFQDKIKFNCPENLLEQFIYDNSSFRLVLRESKRVDMYEIEVVVEGHLQGVSLDLLWDCLVSKRPFIELSVSKKQDRRRTKSVEEAKPLQKILIIDLEKLGPVVQVLDELGVKQLDNHVELRPIWSLVTLDTDQYLDLPVSFTISPKLQQLRQQILGEADFEAEPIPNAVEASLRSYQIDGIKWLERLRSMYLNGILADDMGLGKTLQAITTLTQYHQNNPKSLSLVVCPTSLLYNWKEECHKFNKNLKVLAVDGNPVYRKKLQSGIEDYDIIITSYTLLQKDIEFYRTVSFGYMILDEGQHIKNRGTRNAQSVKMIQSNHRLVLTGTPIENCLDELWSLFDFLMPGLLSSYDRFIEKYIRQNSAVQQQTKSMEILRKKVAPFILRRMKKDVLDDLPPISEIVYHCSLSEVQQDLYRSYAESAREELSKLVDKEGFERVQIHVLATLTRLKQICCHPGIFAKETIEEGDSAKYDLLLELLQGLISGGHKTVIFSQYTRMLHIIRDELQKQNISFEYLDGSSKNRLGIVKKFNEDQTIPIFLVSLKAGGTGLNLVGADTVIHYDMWWNPAVENQATDRVHRMGQRSSVSSYKLITLNTIEEKILELHKRKQTLVKDVISRDDQMLSKLTWEEVLELLQT